jgi:hypothetical protein
LKVLVVNDAELAEAINRLSGEWGERSGGTLAAESRPRAEVMGADTFAADIVIFPARYLGELSERNLLRPMRASVLGSERYDADDVLPLARQKLGSYGGQTMGLPLGVELPLARYPLKNMEAAVVLPETWQALREYGWELRIWPPRDQVENWPATVLLARAVPYASHQQQESVLFDPLTMKARIAEPPFVRALDEWRGQLTPNREESGDEPGEQFGWAELPGASQVFNRSSGEWDPVAGGVKRVPLLAGGVLLAVTKSSRNAATAFDLAGWLSSAEIGRQLGPVGQGMLPVRRSVLAASGEWVGSPAGRGESSQLAGVIKTALSRDDALVIPPIPGVDAYLSALAEEVDKALRSEATSSDALAAAADKWEAITDRLGRDRQRQAYLAVLGIREP